MSGMKQNLDTETSKSGMKQNLDTETNMSGMKQNLDTETSMSGMKQNLESGDSNSDKSAMTTSINDENTNRNSSEMGEEIVTDSPIQSESDETKVTANNFQGFLKITGIGTTQGTTARQDRYIRRAFQANPFLLPKEVEGQTGVGRVVGKQRLREQGLMGRIAAQKDILNAGHLNQRYICIRK
jgi:hypothetical protein